MGTPLRRMQPVGGGSGMGRQVQCRKDERQAGKRKAAASAAEMPAGCSLRAQPRPLHTAPLRGRERPLGARLVRSTPAGRCVTPPPPGYATHGPLEAGGHPGLNLVHLVKAGAAGVDAARVTIVRVLRKGRTAGSKVRQQWAETLSCAASTFATESLACVYCAGGGQGDAHT